MSQSDKPLLDFPCEYTVKVLGRDREGFSETVTAIVTEHAPDAGEADLRPSSKGSFVAVNITFEAQSMKQLDKMHRDLRACEHVSLIL